MKMCQEGKQCRARKDDRPNLSREGRIWRPLRISLEGKETMALINGHWLYFSEGEQWYKLNTQKYGIEVKEGMAFSKRATVPMTEEEKKAKRKERRLARKAKEAEEEDDEEDEEE